MRLQLIPLIVAVIINIAADAYIYNKLKDAFKFKWIKNIHLGLSAFLLIYIIVAVALPRRTIDNNGLCDIMWMLYSYFTFYIPKYFGIIVILIGRIPHLWKHKTLRYTDISALIIAAIVFISMWWGALVTRTQYEVNEVTIEFSNLPRQFDGYRIAQFSDFHLGSYGNDTTFVSEVVNAINNLHPDAIYFTGDLVNRMTSEAYPFKSILSRLHAPNGVYSILGNHDYGDYMDWESPEAKIENNIAMEKFQTEIGWKLMNNSDTSLVRDGNKIELIGVENWGEAPFPKYGKLSKAHHNLNDKEFKILLSHNPNHWRGEVLTKSNIDLMLAGHTHAMQIEFNIFGYKFSPAALRYKEWGGIYEEGSQKLYVNIGLGAVALPMRIGAVPEITLITLKTKE